MSGDSLPGFKVASLPRPLVGVMLGVLFFALPAARAEETGRTFRLGYLSPSP